MAFGAAYAFRPGKDAVSDADAAPSVRPGVKVPWFVGCFLLASVLRSSIPGVATAAPALSHLATVGLTLTLFLIGAGLSARTLRSVGWRPLLQGVLLWVFISAASLGVIMRCV